MLIGARGRGLVLSNFRSMLVFEDVRAIGESKRRVLGKDFNLGL